jgi:ethanolamine utilization cobalamin adenosyltransferase
MPFQVHYYGNPFVIFNYYVSFNDLLECLDFLSNLIYMLFNIGT